MYKHPRARERGQDDRDPEEPLENRPSRHHILETVHCGLPEKLEQESEQEPFFHFISWFSEEETYKS